MVGILTYAAVRHRVMDIDVFIMHAAATVLAGVLLVLPVAAALIWMHHLPAGPSGSLVTGCLLLAALVSLLVFSRFRAYLEMEVESSLFPKRRGARDAIRNLTAELVKLPSRADLHARIASALMQGLGVSGVAVYRDTRRPGMLTLAHAEGSIAAPPSIRVRDIEALDAAPPATSDGVPATPTDNAAPPWEARIPVCANGQQVGLIALGPKESGARIDDADLTLLNMVAAQLAIAMQNAEYVKQIETQKAEIEQLRRRLEAENVVLRAEVRSVSQFKEIIGASAALQRVLALVETVAPTSAPIMIIGETGTGKELIARAIHDLSPRRNGPLISVNCPADSAKNRNKPANSGPGRGLRIERVWTTAGVHPYDEVNWERRDVVMTNWRDGSINFEQRGVEFPDFWSVNATNIVTTKYFRGAVGTEPASGACGS